VLVSLATIIYVTPWFGVAVVPLGYTYFSLTTSQRLAGNERLESISWSPVYGQFSETLRLTTIQPTARPEIPVQF
jgi:hypothetical protein